MRLTLLLVVASLLAAALPARAANVCVTAAGNAQDLRASNRLHEARAALLVCSQRQCNGVVRADCERWLREVDAQAPSLVVRAVDARGHDVVGAHVTIDDAPSDLDGRPVSVDPGQRRVHAQASGGAVVDQRVVVARGEKARVIELKFDVPLEEDGSAYVAPAPPQEAPAPKAPAPNIVPYVLGGVGVVSLVVFGYFEVSGHSAYSDLENGCGHTQTCTSAELDPVKGNFLGAGVSLAIGLVALGAAAITYVVGKPTKPAFSLAQRGFVF